jgi:hypothetical protein
LKFIKRNSNKSLEILPTIYSPSCQDNDSCQYTQKDTIIFDENRNIPNVNALVFRHPTQSIRTIIWIRKRGIYKIIDEENEEFITY